MTQLLCVKLLCYWLHVIYAMRQLFLEFHHGCDGRNVSNALELPKYIISFFFVHKSRQLFVCYLILISNICDFLFIVSIQSRADSLQTLPTSHILVPISKQVDNNSTPLSDHNYTRCRHHIRIGDHHHSYEHSNTLWVGSYCWCWMCGVRLP